MTAIISSAKTLAKAPHSLGSITPAGGAAEGALHIEQVSKTYELGGRSLPVLEDIDLHIPAGQFVSIVGQSGCGKSTLLRLLEGLDTEYTGHISLDGAPIVAPGLERGIVFQDHRLLPWMTVEQNVALALRMRPLPAGRKRDLVREHLALVGLHGFERAYPHQLSGGMAQRAAIARALVNEPKVLLLDEPFGALDALTRIRLQQELQRIWMRSRSTMIMVTHDVAEAVFLSDLVVVMQGKPGRISRQLRVPYPHSRERGAPPLQQIEREILELLLDEPGAAAPPLAPAGQRLTALKA
jgi:ABC-type nitrate/sulfonate/bicarbonate transport system ATPase subunit